MSEEQSDTKAGETPAPQWKCPKCGNDDPEKIERAEYVKKCLACGCQVSVLVIDHFATGNPSDTLS